MSKLQENSIAGEANKWPKQGGERLQKGLACQQPYWNSTAAWLTVCQCQGASWAHIFLFLRWNATGTRMALLAEGSSHSTPQRATWVEYSQHNLGHTLYSWPPETQQLNVHSDSEIDFFFGLFLLYQSVCICRCPADHKYTLQPGWCSLGCAVMGPELASLLRVSSRHPILTVVLLCCETGMISPALQAVFSPLLLQHRMLSLCHAAE